ncbi:MAG: hypothetical protein KA791_14645, partial [Flavobacteriales bacterium]|nr:hypothetical protein [Flavobacteriales bacterium]
MLRTTLLFTALAVITTSQAQPNTAAYDAEVQAHFTADAPGGAVLVAQGSKVLYERALGLADVSTKTALTTA